MKFFEIRFLGFAYPAYCSIKAIESSDKKDDVQVIPVFKCLLELYKWHTFSPPPTDFSFQNTTNKMGCVKLLPSCCCTVVDKQRQYSLYSYFSVTSAVPDTYLVI
jgi:hypothetical protein